MMKKTIISVALAALFFAPSFAHADEARPWLVTFAANYGKWNSGDTGGDGSQALGLTQVVYDTSSWGAALTANYAKTYYKVSDTQENALDISSITDTNVNVYRNFISSNIKLKTGLDVNLPTGKHGYSSTEISKLIVDDINQDLMLVNAYGGGLNFGPYALLALDTDTFSAGAGIKYSIMGEYDPTSDNPNDSFRPGDRLLVLVNGMMKVSGSNFLLATATYTYAGRDKTAGNDVYRSGDLFGLEARYVVRWEQNFESSFGLVTSWQGKSERLDGNGAMNPESGNSNGNVIQLFVNNIYKYSDKITLTGVAGYRQVSSNGYALGDGLYDGGRTKMYLEPGMVWHFSNDMYATAKLRYGRVSDKKDAFSPVDAVYNIYNLDASLVYGF